MKSKLAKALFIAAEEGATRAALIRTTNLLGAVAAVIEADKDFPLDIRFLVVRLVSKIRGKIMTYHHNLAEQEYNPRRQRGPSKSSKK